MHVAVGEKGRGRGGDCEKSSEKPVTDWNYEKDSGRDRKTGTVKRAVTETGTVKRP